MSIRAERHGNEMKMEVEGLRKQIENLITLLYELITRIANRMSIWYRNGIYSTGTNYLHR